MRIYLDNNATTAVDPEVLTALTESVRDVFGNASSIHKEGQLARRVIEDARDAVARLAGSTAREVVFTSGGTESNNAAILGTALDATRFHIVTTAIEHPSVLGPVRELERRGYDVTVVQPSRDGLVAVEAVIEALRPETRLVAMMLANNETGALQPVARVAAACSARGIHLHCDAVQAAGKVAVDFNALGCDTLALSAHKLHGPKGIGALIVRQGVTLEPILSGGAQERRRRAGTENVPLAAAFGAAAARAPGSGVERMQALRDELERAVLRAFAGEATVNASAGERLPNTSSITFKGVDGEGLVMALDLAGIAVSTGAACSSGRLEPSHVLLAMGLSQEEARATIRISLSRFTTAEEIEATVRVLREVVPRCK